MARDPAKPTFWEVVLAYPGFHAVCLHRVSNWLYRHKFVVLGRVISLFARFFTGIEIHPGATIGECLFIDHGMGVVIGETTIIGNNVTIYQGVTLGGRGDPTTRGNKRHPTLGDNVVVGAGAMVIGDINLGNNSRIGANSVVTSDVPPHAIMVGIPAREILNK